MTHKKGEVGGQYPVGFRTPSRMRWASRGPDDLKEKPTRRNLSRPATDVHKTIGLL